jgi:threonine/homoserine/homoserine lactone efflux protein
LIDFLELAVYMFVMSITPGPNNVMLAASGLNFGVRASLPHMLGISFGFGFQAVICALGLGAIFTQYAQLQIWLGWIGAAYLIYLAWRLLGASMKAGGQSTRPLSFIEAAGFQFVNPKAWVMAITVGVLFLPKGTDLLFPLLAIYVSIVAVNFPCILLWTWFGDFFGKVLRTHKGRLLFNVAMAVLLVWTSINMVQVKW